MRTTWKPAALAAVLTVSLAACGGGSSADEGSSGAETRTVEHAMGTAEVPADPERVVVLDTGELDDVLALGVTPVGAVRIDVASDFLSYLGDQTEAIEEVGTIAEPNLEQIAAVDPDLILTSTVRHEALYDQLNAIAPTVMAPDLGDTWKENFRLYAEALGRSDEAEQMLAEFEERAAAVGEQVGTGSTVSLVRFVPGQIRLYSDLSFSGTILTDMGLRVPKVAVGADTFAELSRERITEADADHIVVSTYGPPEDTDQAAVTGGPLWNRLDAVQRGDVSRMNDDLVSGIGIQAANQMLDFFEQNLA